MGPKKAKIDRHTDQTDGKHTKTGSLTIGTFTVIAKVQITYQHGKG